ncbi:MAG: glycosyltransferase family 2 protein [Acidobacteriota bacterium]
MTDGRLPSPLVSVVIPAFNAEAYLAEAVESILTQTYDPLEVIVVDDGSSDGTADVLAGCARHDSRVIPVYRQHAGVTQTFAAGVGLARGAYIARMDDDDVAAPDRIAVQLAWMHSTGVDVCGSQAEVFGAGSYTMRFPETHDDIRRELLFTCAMLYPTLTGKAPILKAYAYPAHAHFDDYELITNLVMTCRLGNVPRELLRYRRHPSQASKTNAAGLVKDFRRYRFRLFNALFPGTSINDQLALDRLTAEQAFLSVDELRAAGRMMAILARTDETRLSAIMIQRWKHAYQRSSDLGPEAEAVGREYLEEMA